MKTFKTNAGQSLTEYLILTMLISIVSLTAAKTLGNTVRLKLQEIRNQINSNVTPGSN